MNGAGWCHRRCDQSQARALARARRPQQNAIGLLHQATMEVQHCQFGSLTVHVQLPPHVLVKVGCIISSVVPTSNHRIKTTHDSTPVFLDVVRKTAKRNTWRMDLCQITVYDALRVGQYVDQSSSHGPEKLGEDILTSPEVIRAQTLHFKPNLNCSRLNFFWGGPHPSCCVRYQALVNL